jgi:predicted dinucleotide-binding enzyme
VRNGLVRDIGVSALDAGPLRIARFLEPLSMLWIDRVPLWHQLRYRRRKK